MKKISTALLAAAIIAALSFTAAGAGGSLRILVNGKTIDASSAYINSDGITMIPLRAVAEALGCNVDWDPAARTVTVTSGDDRPAENALVVLDPGHGGSAGGAAYDGIQEKDLNLSIALRTARLLEESGVTVLMTRADDRDVDLYERTDLANGQEADLFVSIHCNASLESPDAAGVYTCAYSEEGEGWRLAEILYNAVQKAAGAPAFGMEARPDLAVLRTSAMPAALVECGFMSTPEELDRLARPEYQDRLARGIAEGILAYLAQD